MAGCHKNSMSIISEIPLCRTLMSCENKYLQDIKVYSRFIVIGYGNAQES